jgi:phosphatidylserine decarboxylase
MPLIMWIDILKTAPQFLLPKRALTKLAGFIAEVKTPYLKNSLIRWFIRTYGVNMQEALEENPEAYANFNAFFIRQLKPNARPVSAAQVVSPVDGCISELGSIYQGRLLQAKGHSYTVEALLACDTLESAQFENGYFATCYLSPKDYHRVHMPMSAVLRKMVAVPGKLFSVQPTTARVIPQLFAKNKRVVVWFDTDMGPMVIVLVGATIVGAIGTAWAGDIDCSSLLRVDYTKDESVTLSLNQAEEMGYFKLGSTAIVLFTNQHPLQWREDLKAGSPLRMGEALGTFGES